MNTLDEQMEKTMDSLFTTIKWHPMNTLTDDQLRMKIVACNLKGLVQVLLRTDEDPEYTLDFKTLALGLLGTVSWLESTIPDV